MSPLSQQTASGFKAVLFDVDGTLYRQFPVRVLMGLELLSLPIAGRSLPRARIVWRTLRTYRQVREELRADTSGPEALVRRQYLETAKRTNGDPAEIERCVTEWMHTRPLKYLRLARRIGVRSCLHRLSQRGVRLGVLSDYPAADKLRALGLAESFSVVLCATDQEVNQLKPHPAGFLRACALWGFRPAEVLYVGDRPDTDAQGAAAAGMPCAILSTFGWLRRSRESAPRYYPLPSCFQVVRYIGLKPKLET